MQAPPRNFNIQRFRADAPPATHWREATCEEVDCPAYMCGFKLVLKDPEQQDRIDMVHNLPHGRHYREEVVNAGFIEFIFPPGQRCFRSGDPDRKGSPRQGVHWTGVGRPALLSCIVPGAESRRFGRPEDWHEAFNEESYRIKQALERG